VSIHSEKSSVAASDLARLRINRDAAPRRRWLVWVALLLVAGVAAAVYPSAREYVAERRAPEVSVVRATQVTAVNGGTSALPVLVASGYVVARRSSDVGVKTGGRLRTLTFEEGTRVRSGQIIATIEHSDLDAQLVAARAGVVESETQLQQAIASRDEDARHLERQRALAADGIALLAVLTAAEAAAQVSAARVKTAEAAIATARARVAVIEESIESSNVRAPFDGVVIRKRAEVGETVSPFGVQGQSTREGGAIATIADLRELEVQTEVNENSVAKLTVGMPATVKVQAYQDREYPGRLREIFPSADRAKAIVEVRVSILKPDSDVKPEMTASVTFQEARKPEKSSASATSGQAAAPVAPVIPVILVSKRAVSGEGERAAVWVVTGRVVSRRTVTLGTERLDQVEITRGLAPGEAVVLNPPATLMDGERVRVSGP
jgi:RND family efflux transporter MFP subunit